MQILLMFLVLLASFALVGLLVPFSENVLRPVADTASADGRDSVQEQQNEGFSRADRQGSEKSPA